jgi:hypothetical protein
MPDIPQVRRIIFNDEEIGMGFNSQSGLAVGTALEDFAVQANPTAPGGEVFSDVTIINTHEELMTSLGMSFEAQGRYGFFSASVKAQFSEATNYNSTSTFVVCKCVVKDALKRGHNFKVTQEAKELLKPNHDPEDFKRAFGDSFVRALQTGGEFYSVVRITSISENTQQELAAKVQLAFQGIITSVEVNGAFTNANLSEHTRAEHTATMYQKAGIGTQLAPVVEIGEAIARFKGFPEIVRTSPAAYETEVATYDTLPLPLPTPVEEEAFLFALRDAREKKLHFIETRNDLEFARRNPTFFKNPPSDDVLSNAISAYTKLINGVTDHAIKLSRGEIEPPRVFDPSKLSPPLDEPAPIRLERMPGLIPVQSFIGIRLLEWRFAKDSNSRTVDELNANALKANDPDLGVPPFRLHPGVPGDQFDQGFNQEKLNFLFSDVVFKVVSSDTGSDDSRHRFVQQTPDSGIVSPGSEVTLIHVGFG